MFIGRPQGAGTLSAGGNHPSHHQASHVPGRHPWPRGPQLALRSDCCARPRAVAPASPGLGALLPGPGPQPGLVQRAGSPLRPPAQSWWSAVGHRGPTAGLAVSVQRPSAQWRCRVCSQIGKSSQTATADRSQATPAPEGPASLCPRNHGHSRLRGRVSWPGAIVTSDFLMHGAGGAPGSAQWGLLPWGSLQLGRPATRPTDPPASSESHGV